MILGINLEYDKHYTLINLKGELLKSNLKMLEEILQYQFMKRTKIIAIDFDCVNYIDPDVGKSMEQLQKYADLHSIKIVCINSQQNTEKMIRDSNLDSYFEITTKENLDNEWNKKKKFSTDKFSLQFDMKLFS